MQILISASKTRALTVHTGAEGVSLHLLRRDNPSDRIVDGWEESDIFEITEEMDLRMLAGTLAAARKPW